MLATVEGSGVALMQLEVTYNLKIGLEPPEFELVVRAKATAVTEGLRREEGGRGGACSHRLDQTMGLAAVATKQKQ